MPNLRAVLCDVDGVLVDTVDLHYKTLNAALVYYKQEPINESDQVLYYNGLPTKVKLDMLSQKGLPKELHKQIYDLKQDLTSKAFENELNLDISKVALCKVLKQKQLLLAACSNAINISVHAMLKSIGCSQFFDVVLGSDNVINAKPHPEIYLEAADRLGVDIKECIIIEDSPMGIKAAIAAGPKSVIKVKGPHQVNLSLLEKILP